MARAFHCGSPLLGLGRTHILDGPVLGGFALNLDNLARRSIIPKVGERWQGWHGWRRRLATILFDLGVDPEIASKILRHADSAVTRRHYIMLELRKQGRKAIRKRESLVTKAVKTRKKRSK